MKKIQYVLSTFALFISSTIHSQNINWSALTKENRHVLHADFNLEYGVNYGIGYSYHVPFKLPVLIGIDYSFPSGSKEFDDFKTRYGGQIRLLERNQFQFSVKAYGVFRRYENSFVRILNFGSDFTGVIGYYKPKWFIAAEAGFDKAISTNFRHSNAYRNIYPEVHDGWYEPATGGNFYYGLQTGYSIGITDLTLGIGRILEQDFQSYPLVPFYTKLGLSIKI